MIPCCFRIWYGVHAKLGMEKKQTMRQETDGGREKERGLASLLASFPGPFERAWERGYFITAFERIQQG